MVYLNTWHVVLHELQVTEYTGGALPSLKCLHDICIYNNGIYAPCYTLHKHGQLTYRWNTFCEAVQGSM